MFMYLKRENTQYICTYNSGSIYKILINKLVRVGTGKTEVVRYKEREDIFSPQNFLKIYI